MPRKTNLQKYQELLKELHNKEDAFFKETVGKMPKEFYSFCSNGKIVVHKVIGFTIIRTMGGLRYYFGDEETNPTRKKIEQLKNYLLYGDKPTKDNIGYRTEEKFGLRGVKLSIRYPYKKGSNLYFDREIAENYAKQFKAIHEEREKYREAYKKGEINFTNDNYKYLGWANDWSKTPEEIKLCVELGHKRIEVRKNYSGTETVNFCPKCKIYYKVDSSD